MPDPAELEARGSIEVKGRGAIETWSWSAARVGRPSGLGRSRSLVDRARERALVLASRLQELASASR